MKDFKVFIFLLLLSSCTSQQNGLQSESNREIYKYHRADNEFKLIGTINKKQQKVDSVISVIDFHIDSTNDEIEYLNTTLFRIDSISYYLNKVIFTFDLFQYNIQNEFDEECIILIRESEPFLIYNYPWGEYLFFVSDSTDKELMKEVVKDKRLIKRVMSIETSAPNSK